MITGDQNASQKETVSEWGVIHFPTNVVRTQVSDVNRISDAANSNNQPVLEEMIVNDYD